MNCVVGIARECSRQWGWNNDRRSRCSVDEIAAYLGIKQDAIYKWNTEKRILTHRLGRLWRFRKKEVNAWVIPGAANNRGHEEWQNPWQSPLH